MENITLINRLPAASRMFYTLVVFLIPFTDCPYTCHVKLATRTLIKTNKSEMFAKVHCKLLYKMNLPSTKVL